MNPKLLEVLKKAKEVDQRAKKFDSSDIDTLESNVKSRTQNTNTHSSGMVSEQQINPQQINPQQMDLPTSRTKPNVDVNSPVYKQRVKESGLPPEIMKAMLDNPIQQPDAPGTFSMDEESIKQINPNYGEQQINETYQPTNITEMVEEPTQKGFDSHVMRKMIAEEIAKALPSIVEKYFDKSLIRENIEVLKAIKVRKKQ